MTLWQRIVQGMTAFSLNSAVSLVAGLLQARLVFQYLSPADYGSLSVYLSFSIAGSVFLGLGLADVFTSEVAHARGTGEAGRARFLIGSYSVLAVASGLVLLLAFVSIGHLRGDRTLWAVMGVYLFISSATSVTYVLLHSTTRYRRVAAQSVARNLGRVLFLATMPWWWRGSPVVGVALTYPLMELVAFLVSVPMSWSTWLALRRTTSGDFTLGDLVALLTHKGVYASLSVPVIRVIDQLPVWFLSRLVGDAAVGAYSAARAAYLLAFSLLRSVETTLFPLVSERASTDTGALQGVLGRARKYSLWLALTIATAVTALASLLVKAIAGPAYLSAVPLLQLLVWGLVVQALAQSQRPVLYAIGEQRLQLGTEVLTVVLEGGLIYAAIHLIGTSGAVWAMLLSLLVATLIRSAAIHRLAPGLAELRVGLFRVTEADRELWQSLVERARLSRRT